MGAIAGAWPYPRITPLDQRRLLPQLRRAAIGYRDATYERYIERPPAERVATDHAQLLYPLQ